MAYLGVAGYPALHFRCHTQACKFINFFCEFKRFHTNIFVSETKEVDVLRILDGTSHVVFDLVRINLRKILPQILLF